MGVGCVGLVGFFGLQVDSSLFARYQRDSLVIDEAGMFSRVLVGQVEGIARELNPTGGFALDEECIRTSCGLLVSGNLSSATEHVRTTSQMRSPEMFSFRDIFMRV